MKSILFTIFFSISALVSFAQFSVSNSAPYNSSFYLVNDVFAGGNVAISNVNTYGSSSQIGFFSGGATSLGMDSGIVLSTGTIRSLCQTSCTNASPTPAPLGFGAFGPTWMGTAASNNLLNVSNSVPGLLGQGSAASSVNDAAVIWFDFVPTKDTMRFKFVFGSSEWDTWPCSVFNDVFGFFVSGPGITGTYSAPTGYTSSINYANVPGTNIPITISSITNPTAIGSCTNPSYSQYYISNNTATTGIGNCNAYTTVMEVVFPVQKCQTYNFAMAIGDGSDGALNSYVFMEANSFDATGIDIIPAPDYTTLGGDSILYEGCGSVSIHFERKDSIHIADTIQLAIGGSAINGVDYTTIPDSIVYAAGQDTSTLTFTIPNDLIIEGVETLFIFIEDTNISFGCSPTGDTLFLEIHDPVDLTSNASLDTFNCTQAPFIIDANPLTGFPDYQYTWSTGDTTQTVSIASLTQTTDYYVTITDACSIYTIIDTATVVIINPLTSISCPDDTITCESVGANINVQVQNSMPGLNYSWSSGNTTDNFYAFNPFVSTDYIITVTQACAGYVLIDTFNLYVDNPLFTLTTTDDTISCIDPDPTIWVESSYTTPNFDFLWDNLVTDSFQVVSPSQTTTYWVTVTDACGVNSVFDSVTVFVENDPVVLGTQNEIIPCSGDSATISVNAYGGYVPYSYLWSTGGTDSFDIVNPTSNSLYSVSVTDVCGLDTLVEFVNVFVATYPPLEVVPIDTIFQKCKNLPFSFENAEVIGGSGDYDVTWNNWVDNFNFVYGTVDKTTNYTIKVFDYCNLDSTSSTLTVYVPEYDPLTASITPDTTACPGERVDLEAIPSGGNGVYTFKWSTGSDKDGISVRSNLPQSYMVTITEECGETVTKESSVYVAQPKANFDFEFLDGVNIEFNNRSIGASTYQWSFGDTVVSSDENPIHQYEISKDYIVSLIATNDIGCSDSIALLAVPPLNIFIPSGFTPNGDGRNDFFEIQGEGVREGASISKFSIQIFDRWGKMVFESDEPTFQWDGTFKGEHLQVGTYVYKISVEGYNLQKYEDTSTISIISY